MKQVWLLGAMFWVAIMVVVGGLTRLTGSGLSMVDWNVLMGTIPPIGHEAWLEVFDAYKGSPEFQKINFNMSLGEFKVIFIWEYIHRILGRLTGLWFLGGTIFLGFKGCFSRKEVWLAILATIGVVFQGLLGWYMVKSGLVNRPEVSHIRLAMHLVMAFILFSLMWLWYLYLKTKRLSVSLKEKTVSMLLIGLLFFQILYGAFMAGLKAGAMYNTFPKMGTEWVPRAVMLGDSVFYNMFNNPIAIHFIHRWLGFVFLLALFIFWIVSKKTLVQEYLYNRFNVFLGVVSFQIILGVGLILTKTPLWLAALHQLSGLVTLCSLLWVVAPFLFSSKMH